MGSLKEWVQVRYIIVVIVFLSATLSIFARLDVNIGIAAMTPKTEGKNDNHTSEHCPLPQEEIEQEIKEDMKSVDATRLRDKVFNWNQTTQGHILGSFFWSYIVFQMLSGYLAERFGGKWIVVACLFGSGLMTLIIPFAAEYVIIIILLRILMGIVQSGLFSSLFGIICKWIPLRERSICFALVDFGSFGGTILVFATSGLIDEAWGWPGLFFVPGVLCLVMSIIASLVVKSSAVECPFVTLNELNIINEEGDAANVTKMDSLDKETSRTNKEDDKANIETGPMNSDDGPNTLNVLKGIILNKAVMSAAAFKMAHNWISTILASKFPIYLKTILHQNTKNNGYINAIVALVSGVSLIATGYLSERIVEKGWFSSRTRVRKSFSFISGAFNGICIMLIPAAGCHLPSLFAVLFFQAMASGFKGGSDAPLASEMSSNYPSLTYAVMNTVAMSAGFTAPAFAGLVLDNTKNSWNAWSYIFYASGILMIIANSVFVVFAAAERQDFDYGSDEKPGDIALTDEKLKEFERRRSSRRDSVFAW